jgi:hypothetical protein
MANQQQDNDISFYQHLKRLIKQPSVRYKIPTNRSGSTYQRRIVSQFQKSSNNLYLQSISNSVDRMARMRDFEMMDQNEILSAALNIYADCTVMNNEDGRVLEIKSTSEKIQKILYELFYDRLQIDFHIWQLVRNIPIKYDSYIPLLSGENITIEDLSKRIKSGKEEWVYAVQDSTHKIVPGKVTWCDKNYTSNKIVKIIFDDNTYIETAPEHDIVLRDGSKLRADELKPEMSLMPFYRKDNNNKYEIIYNPHFNKYQPTHQLIADSVGIKEFDFNPTKIKFENCLICNKKLINKQRKYCSYKCANNNRTVIHHKDFNKRNNCPTNLQEMNSVEHFEYHYNHCKNTLHTPEVTDRRMKGIDKWLRSDKHKQMLSEKQKGIQPKWWKDYNSSELHTEHNKIRSIASKKMWSTEESRDELCIKLNNGYSNHIIFNHILEKAKILNNKRFTREKFTELLSSDNNFMKLLKSFNLTSRKIVFNSGSLVKILQDFGYNSYTDFIDNFTTIKLKFGKLNPTYRHDITYQAILNVIDTCNSWEELLNHFHIKNKNLILSRFHDNNIAITQTEFAQKYFKRTYNHKVKEIKIIDEIADVYCMTVMGPNGENDRHNFSVCSKDQNGKFDKNNGIFVGNCKYGDSFTLLDVLEGKGIVNHMSLPTVEIEREEGFDGDINSVRFKWLQGQGSVFDNFQVAHFRILGDDTFLPYGRSILDPVRKLWKQLNLIEDAYIVYFITRAPEKRVFKIDVGGINPNDIPGLMQKAKDILKTKPLVDSSGNVDLRYAANDVTTDYFIPIRGKDGGSDITTLPGAQNLEPHTLNYLQAKLFAGLGIPKAYLSYTEDVAGKNVLSQVDITFARTISRIQKMVVSELNKIAMIHLYSLGIDDPDDLINFKLSLTNASSVDEMQKLDLYAKRTEIYTSAIQSVGVDRNWAQKHILKLSKDEIKDIDVGINKDAKFKADVEAIAKEVEQANAPQQGGENGGQQPQQTSQGTSTTELGQPPADSIPGGQAMPATGTKSSFENDPDNPMSQDKKIEEDGELFDYEKSFKNDRELLNVLKKYDFLSKEAPKKDWLAKSLNENTVLNSSMLRIFKNINSKVKK